MPMKLSKEGEGYISALALTWPVKPEKAEVNYENGLLRIEVPLKDPMEDAVKVEQ
jgi:HSP20 family molecular chaperone IbpA